jgi:GT2 family glycosyltransferase
MHFEDEEGKTRWLESDMAGIRMTTMEPGIPPGELYAALTRGGRGHIHLNGLVIRREVLSRSGLMDESIADTLHEDTDFILRLSAVGQLLPGSVEKPASMRRVHAQNRVSAPRSAESIQRDRMRLRAATYAWVREHGTPIQRDLAFRRLLRQHLSWPEIQSPRQRFFRLARFPFRFPQALTEKSYWGEWKDSLSALIRGANGGGRG